MQVLVFRFAPAAPSAFRLPPPRRLLSHHPSQLITAQLITQPSAHTPTHTTHGSHTNSSHTSHTTHGSHTNSSHSTQLTHQLAVVWQAQYTEPSGGAAAHVVTPTGLSCGGKVHKAFWRSCCTRGRRWPAAGCRVAGPVHRSFWRSCCVRGRRWPAAGCRVAGTVHRASWKSCCVRGHTPTGCRVAAALHRAFYTSCCACGRHWPADGCRVAGAVHRSFWPPLARGWLSSGRRGSQSLLEELLHAWPPLARGLHALFHTPSFTHNFVTHHL